MSEEGGGFLGSSGIWGPRDHLRLILWPSRGALAGDRGLRMKLGSLLSIDSASAGMLLRRAVPVRIGAQVSLSELRSLWEALRRLGLSVVMVAKDWLTPVESPVISTALGAPGPHLLDGSGAPIVLSPPVLLVTGTLDAVGQDRSAESPLERIRDPGNFHDFQQEVPRIAVFHSGGLVLLRMERFLVEPSLSAPEGRWIRQRWLLQQLAPDGWCDTGYRWVEQDRKNLKAAQHPGSSTHPIPRREWDFIEYGAMAYGGLRQGVLRFDSVGAKKSS